jgi:hypothetical protein
MAYCHTDAATAAPVMPLQMLISESCCVVKVAPLS